MKNFFITCFILESKHDIFIKKSLWAIIRHLWITREAKKRRVPWSCLRMGLRN
jgi:hypothetical protein